MRIRRSVPMRLRDGEVCSKIGAVIILCTSKRRKLRIDLLIPMTDIIELLLHGVVRQNDTGIFFTLHRQD